MKAFVETQKNANIFTNLGTQVFLSIMSCSDVMVGNSSSGIHEAVSFKLPVVNVGSRQGGRLRPLNVVDCEPEGKAIRRAISLALSKEFRKGLRDVENPYGDGQAGERIVTLLEQFVPFEDNLQKRFWDGPEVLAASKVWKGCYD